MEEDSDQIGSIDEPPSRLLVTTGIESIPTEQIVEIISDIWVQVTVVIKRLGTQIEEIIKVEPRISKISVQSWSRAELEKELATVTKFLTSDLLYEFAFYETLDSKISSYRALKQKASIIANEIKCREQKNNANKS